jgi:CBS domain-containing protein
MAQSINEVMTHDPRTVEKGTPIRDVARAMREADTGAIIVTDNGRFAGLVTDRDIVVRALAEGKGPDTPVDEVDTESVKTLTPDQTVDDAIRIVREDDVRRVPVVQDGRPVGIVSLGDLAIERDPDSALADMSSEPANN